MFDPLAFPYVRAQTYVDGAAPAVLSGDFYNPVQDAIARLYGGVAGYSTLVLYEEFIQPALTPVSPILGTNLPFGRELTLRGKSSPGFEFFSVDPTGPNQYGVYHIQGVANGDRGGNPGFIASDSSGYVGRLRWLFRARLRCSNFSPLTITPRAGLVVGLNTGQLPFWAADSTGHWKYRWEGNVATSTIATVPGQWVTLWITLRDGDGVVRWYIKRDFDPAPILVDARLLARPELDQVGRVLVYQVDATAVAADNVEIDNISFVVER